MKRILSSLLILASAIITGPRASAQNPTYAEKVQRYIATYKDLAIQEQKRSGIPAAITLAQGILESGAGESELATEAANHFGIKCKKDWNGETYNHDDDAADECFRKYESAEASYRDHSDFLKSAGRYAPCFAQSTTDYAAWAYQLKTCGYATSPTYAQRLIRVIEDYKLQQYTYAALDSQDPLRVARAANPGEVVPEDDAPAPSSSTPIILGEKPAAHPEAARTEASRLSAHSETPEEARNREQEAKQRRAAADAAPSSGQPIAADGTTMKDGRRGFYARKGDVLLENAIRYRIRYAKLLELNGLPDEPLSSDRFIYLEKATTTRIEHDVAAMAGRDETAQLASATTTRNAEAPSVPMVASTAGMVPEPKQSAVVPAPSIVEAPGELRRGNVEKAAAAETIGQESTQDATAPLIADEEDVYTDDPTAGTVPVSTQPAATSGAKPGTIQGEPVAESAATPERPKEIEMKAAPAEEIVQTNKVENSMAAAPSTDGAIASTNADAFNIASESAVEETEEEEAGGRKKKKDEKPAEVEPEEPKDEMSRLKARFDKAVYAPAKPAAKPVDQPAPSTQNTTPVKTTAAKATPAATSGNSGAKYYTVQKGDTAFGIAKKHGITVRQLQEWNGLSMDAGLPMGKKLKVQP